MHEDNRICIMGMGYVGLTLAAVMAENDFDVCGVEINHKILASLRRERAHFFEANLDYVIRRNLKRGRLTFADAIPAGARFDVYAITVGTPLGDKGVPRMDMVQNVAREIADHMQEDALVVLRSTVKLGTSLDVVKPILDASGKRYELAFCPERTMEGRALAELPVLPQVVGGIDDASRDRAAVLFQRITPTTLRVSSIQTAELIKLLDNSFRDTFFAFGNEVALLCEAIGVDAMEVIETANLGYERTNIALPGFVGGPCLEKDPHILVHSLAAHDHVPRLIHTARDLNERLVGHVFERVRETLGNVEDPIITLMGVAFKGHPETDDLRGSPSLLMLQHVRKALPSAEIRAQDFQVADDAIRELGVEPVSESAAFEGAHVVLIMNNHRKYATMDVEVLAAAMARPAVIYDVWNVVDRNVDLPEGVTLRVLGV